MVLKGRDGASRLLQPGIFSGGRKPLYRAPALRPLRLLSQPAPQTPHKRRFNSPVRDICRFFLDGDGVAGEGVVDIFSVRHNPTAPPQTPPPPSPSPPPSRLPPQRPPAGASLKPGPVQPSMDPLTHTPPSLLLRKTPTLTSKFHFCSSHIVQILSCY